MFLKLNDIQTIDFDHARMLLKEGDILLFRRKGWIPWLIGRAGEGLYSHVGIASAHYHSNEPKIWECIEFREWKGGRSVNLKTYLEIDNSSVDVYRPSSSKIIMHYDPLNDIIEQKVVSLDAHKVTDKMRRMTGLPYGWKRILWMAQHKMPVLRLFYNMESLTQDCCDGDIVYPVCSTAIAHSFSKAGYDLVHNRSDRATEPSDISRSPLLNYLFTIE